MKLKAWFRSPGFYDTQPGNGLDLFNSSCGLHNASKSRRIAQVLYTIIYKSIQS